MLAILAGCSGSAPSVFGPPTASGTLASATASRAVTPRLAVQLFSRTIPSHDAPVVHLNRSSSWIEPDVKKQELLYASDIDSGTVDIYNYNDPKKIVGQLTGFNFPYGECSDKAGHVFVADFGGEDIVEYKHGGTRPMQTLSDSGQYPIGCAVDPTTGNLAVSNFDRGIAVYQNASGTPKTYTNSNFTYYWPPGYDSTGNIYVEGQNAAGSFVFAELPAGDDIFLNISLDFTMFFPGGVMYDGSYMALTDQEYGDYPLTGIDEVNIEGTEGVGVRGIELVDNCSPSGYTQIAQPWIQDGLVVGGNLDCPSRFDYWNYTNGGYPVKTIAQGIAPGAAEGQTVSK